MVADALDVADHMEHHTDGLGFLLAQRLAVQPHQETDDLVGEKVQRLFHRHDPVVIRPVALQGAVDGQGQIVVGDVAHADHFPLGQGDGQAGPQV